MKYLQQFLNTDIGINGEYLHNIVKKYKNSLFVDLGVREGVSSAILSVNSIKNNNKIYGVDITDRFLKSTSNQFIIDNTLNNSNYSLILGDSSTVGKNWDTNKKVDILFVDTFHIKEFVLTELYFWYNHLNENSHIVFHDSCWPMGKCDRYGGVDWGRVEIGIQEFFNLPDIKEWYPENQSGLYYKDSNIEVTRYTQSWGMTFVKLKNKLDYKKNIGDWEKIINSRNYIVSVAGSDGCTELREDNKGNLQYELVLTP